MPKTFDREVQRLTQKLLAKHIPSTNLKRYYHGQMESSVEETICRAHLENCLACRARLDMLRAKTMQ